MLTKLQGFTIMRLAATAAKEHKQAADDAGRPDSARTLAQYIGVMCETVDADPELAVREDLLTLAHLPLMDGGEAIARSIAKEA